MKTSDIVKNFKQMPWLLKILFGMGVYSSVVATINIISQTPTELNYFDSGFPQSSPLLWHMFSLGMALWGVYVFLRRSYAMLVKYTIASAVVALFAVSSFFLDALRLVDQTERTISIVAISIFSVVSALLMVYPLRQKKYFNRK